MLELFAKSAVSCIKSVPITTIDGSTTAIPDLVCKSPVDGSLSLIEVKTGMNPTFTPSQLQVYAMAQFDNHVVSSTDKLAPFGVPRGTTLPAIDVDVIYATPGKEIVPDQPFRSFLK
ncbi:MAG: hypothetical protein M0006_13720 [Magnetospirillum sp.]|nr:hypothetical protein [Magnetospirillum sp.]